MITAMRADCLDFCRETESDRFDLIIADPPYFRICGDFDFDWASVDDYVAWLKVRIIEFHRVLKRTGSFYLWGGIGYGRGYPLFRLADWMESEGLFTVRNWITQRNTRGYGNKKGFIAAREELLFCTRDESFWFDVPYGIDPVRNSRKPGGSEMGANGKPRKTETKRLTDVWIDVVEASQSSKQRFYYANGDNFPTVKAAALCERIIRASCPPGGSVYVPFAGSGSEVIAAELLCRNVVTTELDSRTYAEILLPRIEAETGKAVLNG